MNNAVIIRDGQCVERDGWLEVSAEVDNERLWFQVPIGTSVSMRAEPFVAAALLEAMCRGVPIHIEDDLPLSPLLHQNLAELQAIYHCWNPELVPIDITARLEEPSSDAILIASCYSGGVDSALTFVRRREELDAIILVLGFDGPDVDWEERIASHQKFAAKVEKQPILIKTNAREFAASRRISWEFGGGLFLCTLGTLLNCRTIYIPSSHTYNELFPWGSHPLTDPLWSTRFNRVVHDGAGFRRNEKVAEILCDQVVLNNLQVCWRSSSSNCGACPKCVRTMLALYLLNAESKKLPSLTDMRLLSYLKTRDENGVTFLEDAIFLASQKGETKIVRQLKRYHRRYGLSQVLPLLDRTLLSGRLRSLYRRFRRPEWLSMRVGLREKDRWV